MNFRKWLGDINGRLKAAREHYDRYMWDFLPEQFDQLCHTDQVAVEGFLLEMRRRNAVDDPNRKTSYDVSLLPGQIARLCPVDRGRVEGFILDLRMRQMGV